MANETDQHEERYALVLSGGGIRFATHAGVVAEMSNWKLDDQAWLERVNVVVGTSAGALYAAHLAAGYTPAQIATLASMFGDPEFKPFLFNINWDKAAAAFLRHDISYVRGALSGFGILTLLETTLRNSTVQFFKQELPDSVAIDPDSSASRRTAKWLAEQWKMRREQPHDDYYYQDRDLMTFGDCVKDLYLIGVNAYTGQKTIFCKVKDEAGRKIIDGKMAKHRLFSYINQKEANQEVGELFTEIGLEKREFKRLMGRVYSDYDPATYPNPGKDGNGCPQLPLALAVRSSISVPGIFEPVKIRRKPNQRVSPPLNPKYSGPLNPEPYDLFVDGGVVDNFSLSVATDESLGDCKHVLGVFLGNLGYRLPDSNAPSSIVNILLNTPNYMGDAIQDWQAVSKDFRGDRVTIINALPAIDAQITDTQAIKDLMKEGRGIAQQFWEKVHAPEKYNPAAPNPLDKTRVWSSEPEQRVFLSEAARKGPASFPDFLMGQAELQPPTAADVVTQIPAVLVPRAGNSLSKGWMGVYGGLLVLAYGFVTLISDLIGEPTGISPAIRQSLKPAPVRASHRRQTPSRTGGASAGWVLLRMALSVLLVLSGRLWAYSVWERANRKNGSTSNGTKPTR